jgi:hypothetical protein
MRFGTIKRRNEMSDPTIIQLRDATALAVDTIQVAIDTIRNSIADVRAAFTALDYGPNHPVITSLIALEATMTEQVSYIDAQHTVLVALAGE